MRPRILLLLTLFIASATLCAAATIPAPATQPAPQKTKTFPTDAEGFIRDFLVLEPIHLPPPQLTEAATQAIVSTEYFPGQFSFTPNDGDAVTIADTPLHWHSLHADTFTLNLAAFAASVHQPATSSLFWGVIYLIAPDDINNARLLIGSNDCSVWWLNGKQVVAGYGDRQTMIDDNNSKRLTLHKGTNVLRFAVINGNSGCDCCARFYDARLKPLTTLTITLTPPAPASTHPFP